MKKTYGVAVLSTATLFALLACSGEDGVDLKRKYAKPRLC